MDCQISETCAVPEEWKSGIGSLLHHLAEENAAVVEDRYQKLDKKLDRIEGKLDKLLEIANRPLPDGMQRAE